MSPALQAFDSLPLAERLFVRARLWSAPLEAIARQMPSGRLLDVGCGHGVLTALLAHGRSDREVVGIDPDERKIAWARASVGQWANVKVEATTLEELASLHPGSFDAVVVADVMYLLPAERWVAFLAAIHKVLRPHGKLYLKEAEADGSWREWKCMAQEKVMVRWLGRTHSSGEMKILPRERMRELIRRGGFHLKTEESLAAGYTTPHVLFICECA